jgi:hypothetical protein
MRHMNQMCDIDQTEIPLLLSANFHCCMFNTHMTQKNRKLVHIPLSTLPQLKFTVIGMLKLSSGYSCTLESCPTGGHAGGVARSGSIRRGRNLTMRQQGHPEPIGRSSLRSKVLHSCHLNVSTCV